MNQSHIHQKEEKKEVLKPISFGDEPQNGGQYFRACRESTEFASHFNFSPKSMTKSSSNGSSTSFGYNSGTPFIHSSKYPQQIITLELDEYAKEKPLSSSVFTPKLQTLQTVSNIPQQSSLNYEYYNEFTSYAVANKDCKQVLNELSLILANYSPDIDIIIDEKQNIISGVVFISNYAVHYTIYIWSDEKNNETTSPSTTRFEFRRQSGDALASAKFLGELKALFFKESNDENDDDDEQDHVGLSSLLLDLDTNLDLDALFDDMNDEEKMNMSLGGDDDDEMNELDELYDSLKQNECISVDELNFLYEKLCTNDGTKILNDIINHEKLTKMIINESLKHKDICVVRASLLILEKLCVDNKINLLLNEKYKLFRKIINLLNHENSLIKKYSIRLLSKMNVNRFNLNENDCKNIVELLKIYEHEWKNSIMNDNGCISHNMFSNIYLKLNVD